MDDVCGSICYNYTSMITRCTGLKLYHLVANGAINSSFGTA
jgi:hypothetical protein